MAETVQQTTIQRPSPYIERAGESYLQKLGTQYETPLTPAGYAPSVAAQSALTQAQQQQAAAQAGYTFDPTTGGVTGAGVASYQPFLDQAATQATTAGGILAGAPLTGAMTAAQQAAAAAQPLLTQAGADITTAGTTLGGVSPYISAAGTQLGTAGTTMGGAATQQAAAAGLTGPLTGQQLTDYTSPYQQAVIDATLASYQTQKGQQDIARSARAVQAGAFGGARQGVEQAVADTEYDKQRALIEGQLRQQGFQQATAARQQDYLNRMGLGQAAQQLGMGQAALAQQQLGLGQAQTGLAGAQAGLGTQRSALAAAQQGLTGTQLGISAAEQQRAQQQLGLGQYYTGMAQLTPSLAGMSQQLLGQAGMGDLAYRQAVADAAAQAEQMRQFEPIERLARLGQGITGMAGGMGTVQTMSGVPAAAPSPLGQAMTAGIGAFGLGKLFGLGG